MFTALNPVNLGKAVRHGFGIGAERPEVEPRHPVHVQAQLLVEKGPGSFIRFAFLGEEAGRGWEAIIISPGGIHQHAAIPLPVYSLELIQKLVTKLMKRIAKECGSPGSTSPPPCQMHCTCKGHSCSASSPPWISCTHQSPFCRSAQHRKESAVYRAGGPVNKIGRSALCFSAWLCYDSGPSPQREGFTKG